MSGSAPCRSRCRVGSSGYNRPFSMALMVCRDTPTRIRQLLLLTDPAPPAPISSSGFSFQQTSHRSTPFFTEFHRPVFIPPNLPVCPPTLSSSRFTMISAKNAKDQEIDAAIPGEDAIDDHVASTGMPRKLRYCITITATMSTMAAFEPDACRMPQYASFQIS